MLLAIDSGNTNIVFAIFNDDGGIQKEWRSSTRVRRTPGEYAVWLYGLMKLEKLSPKDIKNVIIANVVPKTLGDLKTLSLEHFKIKPIVVGERDVKLGISIEIDNPKEVGADRLVNAIAGYEMYGGPLIIIDFGTATTFDVIKQNGTYCGGAIAPGINLSIEALYQAAAKLPRISITAPKKIIGTNTIDAMLSGTFWGYVSMIEGMVKRIQTEFGSSKMQVISTGGLSSLISNHCKTIQISDEKLTLRGLYSIFKNNS